MHRRTAPLLAAAAALALLLLPARAPAADPFQMLTVDEVLALVGKPGVHVFDANNADTYAKGHLPGARFVERESVVKQLPQDKDAKLIYYCKNPK